ncbi:uncharacterized protein BYT42DRAFT_72851 [Radiomyces spectabilis]|uniref:uncharacterized protein n=1 Tax=Radiomyces spectabilis TaxID=64574 RepID=UPI0022211D84|nr:uncharacterized protein BYT42DRAFT_72851 [Radiomyces spectabilis]KAI8371552.1 hypothetical protein BYT42DRAFT_72851 [Radiomyces spectabilis]
MGKTGQFHRRARSKDGKTLVFHFMDAIVTLDYMTDIDVVKTYSKQREELFMKNSQYLPDYYYSNKNYFIAPNDFDADITGLRINEEGNLMAIWSAKYIYIYKRGDADHAMMDPNTVEDEEDIDEDIDKFPIPADVLARFPARWKLRMMVPLPELRSLSISSIHFYNASISDDRTPQNFMFVAFEKGSVYSYLVDDTEAPENISFWTFVTNRWDMVIAMSIVISIFVFNEYHHFS